FDDFDVAVASPLESFDHTSVGSLPQGWTQWSSSAAPIFAVSPSRALSLPNGLAATAAVSTTAARAWPDMLPRTALQGSGAIYLDSLIPAQLLGRGTNLAGVSPSYYAVSVTRGLEVRLTRMQNGASTVLGSLRSADWVANVWLRVTLYLNGSNVRAQVY